VSEQQKKRKCCTALLAHVDAGKTTLAEAILYCTGRSRSLGRVDHGDTTLDTHRLERERGITIFASQAVFTTGQLEVTLLDTPGHVDFSTETERVLQVLDYAVLVISAIDGVQAHTRTLWRLLRLYNIPTFIFVTKMDFDRLEPDSRTQLMAELQKELDGSCIDFGAPADELSESLAMCSEYLLEKHLEGEEITDVDAARLILRRRVFPCFFGSGLKLDGVEEFLSALERLVIPAEYPQTFGAKVFKISRDKTDRLTHIKVTGGALRVKDTVGSEKINQIRIYSGVKYAAVDEAPAGCVCAVTGLNETYNGMGLGYEATSEKPVLEPVMNYRISLPDGCDAQTMLPRLRMLEEEDPQLHITWNEHLQEIHVSLMGDVQAAGQFTLRPVHSQAVGGDVLSGAYVIDHICASFRNGVSGRCRFSIAEGNGKINRKLVAQGIFAACNRRLQRRKHMNQAFWEMLDALAAEHEIVIDRPRGSRHPRYPEVVNTSSISFDGGSCFSRMPFMY